MNLALKYRPKSFDDVTGQKAVSVLLKAMIAKGILEPVLLFTGPSGVGKTTMGRIIAAELNPDSGEAVHQGTHPNVLEIDAASNGSVEAVRNLKRSLNYVFPGHRVVILDEAHALSSEAMAALLHMLEFPPPNVTFIMITTESHKIPKTIRHRCDIYQFKKASVEDLVVRLNWVVTQEGISIDDELIELIALRSEGSYRESLMILGQIWAAGITTVEQFNKLHGEVDFGPFLIKSALSGPVSAIVQLEETLRYTNPEDITDRTVEALRDIMVLKGGSPLSYSGKALELRLELASKLETVQILKAMKIIWDLQTKLSNTDSVRSLEIAFSLIGETLQQQIPVAAPTKSAPLSFADLQRTRSS